MVGARIRIARLAAKMSQAVLADKMGVKQETVSSWERSRTVPNAGQLAGLAEALGVGVHDLVGVSGPSESGPPLEVMDLARRIEHLTEDKRKTLEQVLMALENSNGKARRRKDGAAQTGES